MSSKRETTNDRSGGGRSRGGCSGGERSLPGRRAIARGLALLALLAAPLSWLHAPATAQSTPAPAAATSPATPAAAAPDAIVLRRTGGYRSDGIATEEIRITPAAGGGGTYTVSRTFEGQTAFPPEPIPLTQAQYDRIWKLMTDNNAQALTTDTSLRWNEQTSTGVTDGSDVEMSVTRGGRTTRIQAYAPEALRNRSYFQITSNLERASQELLSGRRSNQRDQTTARQNPPPPPATAPVGGAGEARPPSGGSLFDPYPRR